MSYETQRKQFIRDKQGRFTGPYLEMPNGGVNAEEINVEPDEIEEERVSKALRMKPMGLSNFKMPQMPKPPKPAVAPTMPKPTTVPGTKTPSAGQPRIKQTGVSKADDKTKDKILLGTGLAATPAWISTNRVSNAINDQHTRYYDSRIKRAMKKKPVDPRDKLPKELVVARPADKKKLRPTPYGSPAQTAQNARPAGRAKSWERTIYSSPEQKAKLKAIAAANVKEKYRKIHRLQTKRARLPLISPNKRAAVRWGTGAVAIGGTWAGARGLARNDKKVSKATKREVDAAMVGTLGGAGAYQGAGYALKPLDRRAERKIAADDDLRAIQRAYQNKARPKNVRSGDPAWRPYFRNYPKNLPGGTMKRTLAVTHTGPSGMALTGLAGAAAGGGALALSRRKKGKVSKMSPDPSAVHVMGALGSSTPNRRRKKPQPHLRPL